MMGLYIHTEDGLTSAFGPLHPRLALPSVVLSVKCLGVGYFVSMLVFLG